MKNPEKIDDQNCNKSQKFDFGGQNLKKISNFADLNARIRLLLSNFQENFKFFSRKINF